MVLRCYTFGFSIALIALVGFSVAQISPSIESRTDGSIHLNVPSGSAVVVNVIGANGGVQSSINLTDVEARLSVVERDTNFLNSELPDIEDALGTRIDDLLAQLATQLAKAKTTDDNVARIATLVDVLDTAATTSSSQVSLLAQCQAGIANAVRVIESDTQHIGTTCPVGVTPSCTPFPSFNLGVAVGSGTALGSTREMVCNAGFRISNAANKLTVCQRSATNTSNVEWSVDAKDIQCISSPTTQPTQSPLTSYPTQGASWRTVYRQKNCINHNQGSDLNRHAPNSDCFSILSDLSDLSTDGVWTLRLSYPQAWSGVATGKTPTVTWTQESDPTKFDRVSKFTLVDDGPVPGFFFKDNFPRDSFQGLCLSRSAATYLDGQDYSDQWWFAVGTAMSDFPASTPNLHDTPFQFGRCNPARWDACWVQLEVFK